METTATVPPKPIDLPQGLTTIVALVLVVSALVAGYQMTLTPVTLVVDGRTQQLHTHQDTISTLLMDVGLTLHPQDIVIYRQEVIHAPYVDALDVPIAPDSPIEVRRARPVHISADGHSVQLRTHATSVEAVLAEARLSLLLNDEVEIEGEFISANPGHTDPGPIRITVHRAVPFTLHENGRAETFYTTAPTVGEALRRAGLMLYMADGVEPGLGERMSAGLDVYVDRSIPVTVQVDGRILRARTHRERVSEVLSDLGVVLTGQDYTTPTLESSLGEDATIRVCASVSVS